MNDNLSCVLQIAFVRRLGGRSFFFSTLPFLGNFAIYIELSYLNELSALRVIDLQNENIRLN